MKLLRFHLSTLLLFCIFSGALIGLFLDRDVWRLERHQQYGNDSDWKEIESLKADYPWLYGPTHNWDAEAFCTLAPGVTEQAAENSTNGVDLSLRRDDDLYRRHVYTLNVGGKIQFIDYSPDHNYLAAATQSRISIYRRTRDYGWRGWLKIPVFWVAAASGLWIGLILMRNLIGMTKRRRTRPNVAEAAAE